MRQVRCQSRVGRRFVALFVALGCLLGGCSYGRAEPGLFGRSSDPLPTPQSPVRTADGPQVNPELPVVGEAVWTSAEGLEIQVRIAVHAVRRMSGATVLDWSVTPLRGQGLKVGEPIPPTVNLGLTRLGEDNINVLLVDGLASRAYRPLTTPGFGGLASCLCSPVRLAERNLRIGETQLLQVAFPPLPDDLATVDVDVATVPIFAHIPVTGVGLVPSALRPVSLGRDADASSVGPTAGPFSYRGGQRFLVSIDEVFAGSTFTSVRWTIQSLTAGDGLDGATRPPFADSAAGPVRRYNPSSASGPQLRLTGRSNALLRARQVVVGPLEHGVTECLCSDLRVWASSLQHAEQQASVVTNFPALPIGTQRVDVVLPGLKPLREVEVTAAPDAAIASGAATPRRSGTWTYSADNPPSGWTVDQWPTPLPDPTQLTGFSATIDPLVR